MNRGGYQESNFYENAEPQRLKRDGKGFKKERHVVVVLVSICVVLLLAIFVVGVAILIKLLPPSTVANTQSNNAGMTAANMELTHSTCDELRKKGIKTSGTYQSTNDGVNRKIYCDMTTDGGGWTLVASVHRKDDGNKCNVSDMWSYNPWTKAGSISAKGSSSWTDKSEMGSLDKATSEDYKGAFYYNGKSSDVMLWHVPNDVDVADFDDKSFLKYHTSNGFLTKYGSSLRRLFKDHAPLESLDIVGLDSKIVPLMRNNISPSSVFTDWYSYHFNAVTSSAYITNTNGSHTLDILNEVYFRVNDEPYQAIKYGKSYTDSKTYHLTSIAGQPFTTLATVSNIDGYPSKFKLKVISSHEPNERTSVRSSSFHLNGFNVYFRSYYRHYRRGKPSVDHVLFHIQSEKWNSAPNTLRYTEYLPSKGFNHYEIHVQDGVKNIILGYALLTRLDTSSSRSRGVSSTDIQSYLEDTMRLLDWKQIKDHTFMPPPAIYTPVVFTKGSISYPNNNVIPGFVQFRAYDEQGSPYAICPGVRVRLNEDPAKFCIGSANTGYNTPERCGDFSAWETLEDHVFVNRSVSADKEFVNDLHSTILIFTR